MDSEKICLPKTRQDLHRNQYMPPSPEESLKTQAQYQDAHSYIRYVCQPDHFGLRCSNYIFGIIAYISIMDLSSAPPIVSHLLFWDLM